jgi:hypothetical protein
MLGTSSAARTARYAAELNDLFGRKPFFKIDNSGRLVDAYDEIILGRRTDELKLGGVELDARLAEDLLQEKTTDKVTDYQTVRFGKL